jgi:thioredoxin-related protein
MKNKAKNKYYTVRTTQKSNTQTHSRTFTSIKSGGVKLILRPKRVLHILILLQKGICNYCKQYAISTEKLCRVKDAFTMHVHLWELERECVYKYMYWS